MKTVLSHAILLACAVGAAFPAFSVAAEPTILHVAPGGSDAWSGRMENPAADKSDGPLASLAGARDALRKLRAAGKVSGPVRVLLTGGTYRLTEPVDFLPEDSGTPEAPVAIEAAPNARSVVSGGRILTGWTRQADGVWSLR